MIKYNKCYTLTLRVKQFADYHLFVTIQYFHTMGQAVQTAVERVYYIRSLKLRPRTGQDFQEPFVYLLRHFLISISKNRCLMMISFVKIQ